MDHIVVKCECSCELLLVEHDSNNDECFLVWYYLSPVKKSLWQRIRFLFGYSIPTNEVILSNKNARIMADYINSKISGND